MSSSDKNPNLRRLRDYLHEYILSDDQLQEVYHRFGAEIQKGLERATRDGADTKCYVTYVQDLPTGDEQGAYLALDLGGSNFRVLLVTLKGDHEAQLDNKVYEIPKHIMLGSGRQLFDHIATCLHEFVLQMGVQDMHLPLGFTFSFPCTQLGLTKAVLMRWTKGFNCSGVVGEDVGRLLQEALTRRGNLRIDVMAILNDTIGTLMACAHRNPACRIGLIVGTGCNACYYEKVENVEMLEPEYRDKTHMIINIEWGAFGDHGALEFIRTDLDQKIDRDSINKGGQIFEKMLAGMYLGELVRMLFLKAVRENLMFTTCCVQKRLMYALIKKVGILETQHISTIEGDKSPNLEVVRKLLRELFCIDKACLDDCQKLKFICEVVTKRSGHLIGTALSFLVNKMDEQTTVIAVDGSVFRYHPKFASYMREGLKKFVRPELNYSLMLSEDGSGRGAALVAAVAAKEANVQ